ncbi:serine hydrolase [Streptomyces sp. NPDC008150]|uniref:serine hydrolase n=1 Tax=Streptomyces sp. NPDC008150 TaxID=3364816 RepID=UPI0036EBECF8
MESHRAHRSGRAQPRRRSLAYTAVATVVVVGGTVAGTAYVKAQDHHPRTAAVSSATTSNGSASEEASVEPVAQPSVDHDAELSKALGSVSVPSGASLSVSVLDLDAGASATYGTGTFDTASIVKVDILATLLLQAQDDGRALTAQEKTYATDMIENSDNDSASALWRIIGKADGLAAANKRFGLTSTQGGDGMLWGLTQTTAADQLTLLQQVFGDDSKLTDASRSYLQGLMKSISAGQQWGVSSAADGSAWALKNGWLQRSTTELWDINSIGRVTAGGHDYLVVTLSNGNETQLDGETLVEAAAKAAVSAFTGGSASASASASADPSGT